MNFLSVWALVVIFYQLVLNVSLVKNDNYTGFNEILNVHTECLKRA